MGMISYEEYLAVIKGLDSEILAHQVELLTRQEAKTQAKLEAVMRRRAAAQRELLFALKRERRNAN